MKKDCQRTNPDASEEMSPKKRERPPGHCFLCCLSEPWGRPSAGSSDKGLFGLYPGPRLVSHKVPYFPWKISCLAKLEGLSEARCGGLQYP